MKKQTGKKTALLLLTLLILAAACWFSVPRRVLRDDGADVAGVYRNGDAVEENAYDSDSLLALLRTLCCRPCFMERVPDTLGDWELDVGLPDGDIMRIERHGELTTFTTARGRIRYRVIEPEALTAALRAIET